MYQIVYWQLLIIMGLSLVLLVTRGKQSFYACALGGLAYWVPTMLFVWRTCAHQGARAAKKFMAVFFGGEALKLIGSAALFVGMAITLPVNIAMLMVGYIGAIVAFWVAGIMFFSKTEGARS
jgi:ATP synthase protein I